MDIKHVLSLNPLRPAYAGVPQRRRRRPTGSAGSTSRAAWSRSATRATGFSFDNELPRHQQYLAPYRLADRLVTNGEWLEFMADGGYRRHELWLSDGWARVNAEGWRRAVLLDRARRRVVRAHPQRHLAGQPGPAGQPRQLLRGRGLRHLGRQAAAQRGRVGARRRAAALGTPDDARQPRRRRRRSTRAPPGRRPAGCARCSATAGSGPPRPTTPTRASTRPRARSASTTASSCPTRWCCAAAARSPRPATPARPTATSSRTAPAGRCPGVRLADGAGGRLVTAARTRLGPARARARPAAALVAGRPARPGLASRGRCRPSGSTTTRARGSSTRSPGCRSTTRPRPSASILRDARRRDRRAVRRDHPGRARQRHQRQDPARCSTRSPTPGTSPGSCRSTSPRARCATPPSRSRRPTPASRSRRSSATSPCTWATSRATTASWSRSSAAPSATSTSRSARAFLGALADSCEPGDWLLLGTDLVKDADRLIAAYDDPGGVTEQFVRNGLRVLNRELGADFDLDAFTYVPFWDPHLQPDGPPAARRDAAARVTIPGADDRPPPGQRGGDPDGDLDEVHRRAASARSWARSASRSCGTWTDARDDFAVTLARKGDG